MTESSEPATVAITEDEAALYDRQIRLWGLEAQERMRNATILIINLRGVAAETIKNIVLAGIGSLLLVDTESVTEEDLGAGFLFREGDVGKKRVDAARPHIEALNPLVSVKTFSDAHILSEDSLAELLKDVRLLCVTDSSRAQMLRLDEACRKTNTLFYAGGSYGLMGYIFTDLLKHEHLAPDRSQKNTQGAQPKMTRQVASYPSFSDALHSLKKTFSSLNKRQTKDVNPTGLFSILALWEFQSRHQGKLPSIASEADELEIIANDLIASASVNTNILKALSKPIAQALTQTAAHEFSPVCAVVGGLLAQDILKALAGREPPYANFLVFDGTSGSGNVVALGIS